MSARLMLLSVLCLSLPVFTDGQNKQPFETVFENPLENFPLQNIEFDLQTNNYFVSGKNVLYKFSQDKNISRLTKLTGPDANCLDGVPEEKVKAYCGDDYNSVMVVTTDGLITCSTLKGGLCLNRNKTSLDIISGASANIRLVSDDSPAVGMFLNISDRSDPGTPENIVLFAKQYTMLPLPLLKLEQTAIFSVSPKLTAKVMEQSDLGNIFDLFLGGTNFQAQKMDYRVVMENEKFVFMLVNQNSQSKLVKICKSIDSKFPKKVYEDIPIMCNTNGTNFSNVEHGSFVSVSGEKLLVVLFSNLTTGQSSVCVFNENEIYEAFLESRRHRFGCPKHDLKGTDFIFFGKYEDYNQRDCISVPFNKSNQPLDGVYDAFYEKEFCNEVVEGAPQFGVIVGLLPLIGQTVYTSNSHRGTVVGSTVINDLVTLYIGTNNGYVIQVYYDPDKKETIELSEMKVDKSEIRSIRTVNNATYIMSQNKIVRMLQQKNCGQFSENCQKCIGARDANCGWCVVSGRCTTRSECSSITPDYWLPSVRNECLSLEFEGHPRGFGYKLDNDSLEDKMFTVQFMPRLAVNSSMDCRLDGNKLDTRKVGDGIQCTIPIATTGRPTSGQTIRYEDGDKELQIIWNEIVIARRNILFYKCSSFNSCGSCLEQANRTDCYWCNLDAVCRTKRGACTNDTAIYSQPYTDACPQIKSGNKLKIPSGRKRTLKFEGENLQSLNSMFTYECVVDSRISPGERIGSNMIQCANMMIDGDGNKIVKFKYGPKNKTVQLETFEGNVIVEVYKCGSLSPTREDCSTCQHFNETEGYECHWCGDTGCVDVDELNCKSHETCGGPVVTRISPADGPTGGNTMVTIEGYNFGLKNPESVSIANVACKEPKLTGRRLTCRTGALNPGDNGKSGKVVVNLGVGKTSEQEDILFTYKVPVVKSITPSKTIKSGGNTIVIMGSNLNIGNKEYEIELISKDGSKTSKCVVQEKQSMGGVIACKPQKVDGIGMYSLHVTFDSNTTITHNGTFEYIDDPVVTSTSPADLKSISSGGTLFFVNGERFDRDVIQNVMVKIKDSLGDGSHCRILDEKKIECKFPRNVENERRRRKRATRSSMIIQMDGFTHEFPTAVTYVDDPLFVAFNQNSTYTFDPSKEESIKLIGSGLATVTKKDDYKVLLGSGICAITNLSDTELICRPPSKEPSPYLDDVKLLIRVEVGYARQIVGIVEYASEFPITIIIICVLVAALIIGGIVAVIVYRRVKVRNKMKIAEIMTEMQDLEQNTMRMNQDEFAEMQLNITDIKRDLVSTGIPYHSYQNYTQYILFPKEVEAGSLSALLQHSGYSGKNVEKAMDQFEKLMSNKYFVKSLVGTLEKQRKITLSDKAQFSANFSVVMMGKMRDFFEIVNCLLSTLVDSSHKKQHKTLFNRFESISLRLLSHWLSVSLYPHLKDGGGSSLFMLYKSTQTVVEKRPVDEVTGEAKNTLSEDNFLREKIDYHTMKLEIDLNGNGNLYACEVLDCDTINQVKSKCLYQIYKNKPASEMPSTDEVDLEWMAGKSGRLTLSNIDQTSEKGDGMVRRNTLQHYHVLDGSHMALLYKFSPDDEQDDPEDPYMNQRSPSDVEITIPPNVQLIQSVSSSASMENLRQWHLIKNIEEEESHEKGLKLKDIGKSSHITNLMHTKLVLQDNVKEVFDSVLNHETVPLVVHYLFGVLENLANKNGVEPDTLLCWKSESYAMRVWATLLVRPEFLFDIQKAKHVEPCLNVIKQVFIDCFHATKISKDSSLQKLLFAQEVPHYQKKTEQFYKALGNKAAITDTDFWNEMSRLSALQAEQLKFSKPAALQKLYKFVQQYVDEIIEDLDIGDETSGLRFGAQLDDIVQLMDS